MNKILKRGVVFLLAFAMIFSLPVTAFATEGGSAQGMIVTSGDEGTAGGGEASSSGTEGSVTPSTNDEGSTGASSGTEGSQTPSTNDEGSQTPSTNDEGSAGASTGAEGSISNPAGTEGAEAGSSTTGSGSATGSSTTGSSTTGSSTTGSGSVSSSSTSNTDYGTIKDEDKAQYDGLSDKSDYWIAGVDPAGYTYTGANIKPSIRVYKGTKLIAAKNYTVTYSNNIKAASEDAKSAPRVKVKIKSNGKTKTVKFSINKIDLEDPDNKADAPDISLGKTGSLQKGTTTVSCLKNGKRVTLKAGTDFTYKYLETGSKAYKYPGKWTVTVVGKGNYEGELEFTEVITSGTPMSKLTYTVKSGKFVKLGTPVMPSTVRVDIVTGEGEDAKTKRLKGWEADDKADAYAALEAAGSREDYDDYPDILDCDYVYYCENNTQTGTAYIYFLGIPENGYEGTVRKTYKIKGNDISTCKVTMTKKTYTYTGEEIEPAGDPGDDEEVVSGFQVRRADTDKAGQKALKKGVDYSVSYKNNKKVGTATIVLKGMGAYSGTLNQTFTIKKISSWSVEAFDDAVAYTKGGAKPDVVVVAEERVLTKGTDYTVKYENNTKTGTATATVTGKGAISGTKKVTFKIVKSDLGTEKVSVTVSDTTVKSSGGINNPTVKVKDTNGAALVKGTDYTVKYVYAEDVKYSLFNTKKAGDAVGSKDKVPSGTKLKAVITGKGYYTGETSATFTAR